MREKVAQHIRRASVFSVRTFLVLGLLVGSLPVLITSPTYAEVCTNAIDPSANDILFFDKCEVNVCGGSSGLATIAGLRGANNGEKIYNYWIDAGFVNEQAAGITGSMKHEGGFSPFRQENGKTWPSGGWGIAQFTWDPGQRGNAVAFVRAEVGDELFNTYYVPTYGGAVLESNGFVPTGVPQDVNDKFLLAELNYLQQTIKTLVPNDTRWSWYNRDWGVTKADGVFLFDYLKTVTTAGDAAKAWTYLYEAPGDIKATSTVRATSAEQILNLYAGAEGSSSCGGISSGGMTFEEAKAFMEVYKQIDNGDPNGDKQYLEGSTCHLLTDNCVKFSSYFVNKYTTLNYDGGNGGLVLNKLVAANPQVQTGTVPKPYALFSIREGRTICSDGKPCGHTGIILGVDEANNKIYVGEAAWCDPSFTGAHEESLSEWSDGRHMYGYLDPYLKPEMTGQL